MAAQFDFGGPMKELGTIALSELIKSDYGKGSSFDGIAGHGVEDHGGHGPHYQINLYKNGVKGSGMTTRFLSNQSDE